MCFFLNMGAGAADFSRFKNLNLTLVHYSRVHE